MVAKLASSSKPRDPARKRASTKATQLRSEPVKKVASKAAPKKTAAKGGRMAMVGDFFTIGIPKPRTGQAAIDLAVRAGVINEAGDLKPRFR